MDTEQLVDTPEYYWVAIDFTNVTPAQMEADAKLRHNVSEAWAMFIRDGNNTRSLTYEDVHKLLGEDTKAR